MVAIRTIVTGSYLDSDLVLVIQLFDLIVESFGVIALGVEEHKAFIATTKHINIAKQFDSGIVDQGMFSSILRAFQP